MRSSLLIVLLLALLTSAWGRPSSVLLQDVPAERIGTVGGLIDVAPLGIKLPSGERFETPNPVARALEFAAPGTTLVLKPGEYAPLQIGMGNRSHDNARTKGGMPGLPIVIRGQPGVRFVHRGKADTIAINQKQPTHHIHFENVEIEPGYRAGVMFYDLADTDQHTDFHFYDCKIIGKWNHPAKTGDKSKWGVLGHDLNDFVFAGRSGRGEVRDIHLEHAFYIQSPRGDITLENLLVQRVGRCFFQITARERSGPPGKGTITIRNNEVRDTGISDADAFKGGTAFTFAGGLRDCEILVENNSYRAGFDKRLLHLTTGQQPYGTAAFVAWDGGQPLPNGRLTLRNNDFELAGKAGDRPLVSIGACNSVSIEGSNRFVTGANPIAIEIQPIHAGERQNPQQVGELYLSADATVEGQVRIGGKSAGKQRLAELAVPLDER
ncbi:MAG: hypothetical protein AAFZ65_12285 [Planctomycetota bacterium]